jgi:predicted transcriptional regulator
MSVIRISKENSAPYAQIPNELIRDPRVSQSGFRLMAYLMSHSEGYELTIEQIQRETGLGRHSINEGRKNLEELGWLETMQSKRADGKYEKKTWILKDPTAAGFPRTEIPVTAKSAHKNTNKELKNTNKENSDDVESSEWLEFWEIYPRKDNKKPAMTAFRNLPKKKQLLAIEGAKAYARSELPEPKFIPQAATWLNQERWLNDYTPKKSGWNF